MQEYVFYPTNDRPAFRFVGDFLHKVSSERPKARQWTEIEAYRTRGGKWVIVMIGGVDPDIKYMERRVDVWVFDSVEELTRKVGHGRLAEKLYREIGISEITIE